MWWLALLAVSIPVLGWPTHRARAAWRDRAWRAARARAGPPPDASLAVSATERVRVELSIASGAEEYAVLCVSLRDGLVAVVEDRHPAYGALQADLRARGVPIARVEAVVSGIGLAFAWWLWAGLTVAAWVLWR